jgi:hypothetical protein
MSAVEKLKVMKVANWLIEQLMDCDDIDFVDRVLAAVSGGEIFFEDEMEEITMVEYFEGEEE